MEIVGEEGGNAGGCVGVVVLMHLLLGPLLVVFAWPPSSPPRSLLHPRTQAGWPGRGDKQPQHGKKK